MGTHHINNTTAGTVTVNANSVNAHTNKIVVCSDADARTFAATAGVTVAQIAPGQDSDGELTNLSQGYISAKGS
jgi:hypothetical protein